MYTDEVRGALQERAPPPGEKIGVSEKPAATPATRRPPPPPVQMVDINTKVPADIAAWLRQQGRTLTEALRTVRRRSNGIVVQDPTPKPTDAHTPPAQATDKTLEAFYKGLGCGHIGVAAEMAFLTPAEVDVWMARGMVEPEGWYRDFYRTVKQKLSGHHATLLAAETTAAQKGNTKVSRQLRHELHAQHYPSAAGAPSGGGRGPKVVVAQVNAPAAVVGIPQQIIDAAAKIPAGLPPTLKDYIERRDTPTA